MSFNMNIPKYIVCVYLTNGRKKIIGYKDDLSENEAQNIKASYCESTVAKIVLEDLVSRKAEKTFFCN